MRIETLPNNNLQTQGAQRRSWLQQYAPEHLQWCSKLISRALELRSASTSRSTLVLGAGASTEVPLRVLTGASEEVVLADFDLAAMRRGLDEIESPVQRRRVRCVQCDVT